MDASHFFQSARQMCSTFTLLCIVPSMEKATALHGFKKSTLRMHPDPCARQSAPSGFKRRSNPTIGRRDIEYLPTDRPGGESRCLSFVFVATVFAFCAPKKMKNPQRWPRFLEKGSVSVYTTSTYLTTYLQPTNNPTYLPSSPPTHLQLGFINVTDSRVMVRLTSNAAEISSV